MGSLTFAAPKAELLVQLKRIMPFAAFRPEDLPELISGARQAIAAPGTTLQASKNSLYAILEGAVCLLRRLPGHEHRCLVEISDAPCLFGEAALFDDQAVPIEAEVLRQALIVELRASTVRRCLTNSPAAQLRMLGYMSASLKRLVIQITMLKLMTGPRRLAQFLISLVDHSGRKDGIDLPFEKKTLAALLGMTPESLSRAFHRLKPLGVGTNRAGSISIDDVERLRQFIEAESAQ